MARRAFVATLVLHVALVGYGGWRDFPTRDEVAHVPAGLVTLTTGTFSLYRVNPPLPRALAALPVLCASPDTSTIGPSDRLGYRNESGMARWFADSNASRYLALTRLARLAGLGWSVFGAWLIWRWAGELYGPVGGLVGAALWCFGPLVLSHARYATPDVPAAVAALGATYVYRRHLRGPEWGSAILAGAALGVAHVQVHQPFLVAGVGCAGRGSSLRAPQTPAAVANGDRSRLDYRGDRLGRVEHGLRV